MVENKITKFINGIRQKHPKEIEDTFMNGYCYWFARILAERFKGEVWFNPLQVHFACNIGIYLYDVTGMIEDAYGWVSWEQYQIEHHAESMQIIKKIIKKE